MDDDKPIEDICNEMDYRRFIDNEYYCVLDDDYGCMFFTDCGHDDGYGYCEKRSRLDMLQIFTECPPDILFQTYKWPHERYKI